MKQLLVLDLDETLVYATERPLDRAPDFVIEDKYYVYRRPHLAAFLGYAFGHFGVGIWTSASADYATAVVASTVLPVGVPEFVWDIRRCTRRFKPELQRDYWIKDLRKLRQLGYALERTLMIDDSAEMLERNYGNLIRVSQYTGEPDDKELHWLMLYLPTILAVDNVRTLDKRAWRSQTVGRQTPDA